MHLGRLQHHGHLGAGFVDAIFPRQHQAVVHAAGNVAGVFGNAGFVGVFGLVGAVGEFVTLRQIVPRVG